MSNSKDGQIRNGNDDCGPENHASDPLSSSAVQMARQEVLGQGVGYKNPPQHTRFARGQSGNPNGRPRKQAAIPMIRDPLPGMQALLKLSEQRVSIREGEEVRQITMLDALNKAQANTALKGNAFAQKCVIERIETAQRSEAMAIEHDHEIWLAYQQECRNAAETARRKGEPLPEFLPHPDDLVFQQGKRVHIAGPVDATSLGKMQETIQLIDTLLLQDALDRRDYVPRPGHGKHDQPHTALLAATLLNNGLPERMQLSDSDILLRMLRYEGIPRRPLLKQLYVAWRALGKTVPRGATLPAVGKFMDVFEEGAAMLQELHAQQQLA